MDLAAASGFDQDALLPAIQSVRPGLLVLELSAKTGAGRPEWLAFLDSRRHIKSLRQKSLSSSTHA